MTKSILVVDDTRSMRKMVAAVLAGAGYEVSEAGDGVFLFRGGKGLVELRFHAFYEARAVVNNGHRHP